jgi:hypothetical protein
MILRLLAKPVVVKCLRLPVSTKLVLLAKQDPRVELGICVNDVYPKSQSRPKFVVKEVSPAQKGAVSWYTSLT